MFYRPEDGHGLPYNPFNAIIAPRPIAWVSSRSASGTANLAPYSFFNGVAYTPPQVMFSSTNPKDSLANIRETGVFCVNIVEAAARDRMNITSKSVEYGEDEFELSGTAKAPCETIDCDRVADAPASLECRMTQIVELEGGVNFMTIGRVTGIHIRENCLRDGRFDVTTFKPLARLGYRDYTIVEDLITLARPDD